MKRKLTRVIIIVLILVLSLQGAVFAETANSAELRANTLTMAYGVDSLQFSLMDNGEIVLSGHSGAYSKYSGAALSKDTMYGIGSVSKMFVTAVIMKLVDDGKMALDTPITAYIPEFTMADERYKAITVRMLLNHSSGLMGSTYSNGFLWSDADTQAHDTLLADLKTQRLKAAPGAFSVYCNDGFTLAEIVAERVTGKAFTTLIHEYFTGTLGMTGTKTPQDSFDRIALARTYSMLDPAQEMPSEAVGVIGTGGVYSTAEDLCRFAQVFTGEAGILSAASIEATMAKEYLSGQWLDTEDNIIGYGLGWDSVDYYPFNQYGITALVKGGDTLQYHAALIVLPEYNISMAVTASGGNSTYLQVMAAEILLEHLLENGIIDEILPDKTANPPQQQALDAEMKQYEGLYGDSTQLYLITMRDEGVMEFAYAYMPEITQGLIYTGNGVFTDKTGIASLYFLTQNGKNYLMQESLVTLPGVGQTYANVYAAQQLETYDIPEEAADAWEARNGGLYFTVTDKYSSQSYSFGLPVTSVITSELTQGYLSSNKIIDANTALTVIQIPLTGSRDLHDVTFYEENGVEYIVASDNIYMGEDGIAQIYEGAGSISTIQSSGHTRWYSIGEALEGKTITITCPANSGFALYDAEGNTVNQSAVTGSFSAVLSGGGYIAFAGEPGTVFSISIR